MLRKYIPLLVAFLFSQQLNAQAPTITSVSPMTAGPGDTVTIRGTNFTNVSSLFIAGTRPFIWSATSDSTITATIPANIVGRGNQVTFITSPTAGQFDTASIGGFTWTAAPVITSVIPDTASIGDTVTITGKYLSPDGASAPAYSIPKVTIGGTLATTVIPISFSKIQVVVGNGSLGNIVLNSCCFGSTSYSGFVHL